jgi:hypothetical protein
MILEFYSKFRSIGRNLFGGGSAMKSTNVELSTILHRIMTRQQYNLRIAKSLVQLGSRSRPHHVRRDLQSSFGNLSRQHHHCQYMCLARGNLLCRHAADTDDGTAPVSNMISNVFFMALARSPVTLERFSWLFCCCRPMPFAFVRCSTSSRIPAGPNGRSRRMHAGADRPSDTAAHGHGHGVEKVAPRYRGPMPRARSRPAHDFGWS